MLPVSFFCAPVLSVFCFVSLVCPASVHLFHLCVRVWVLCVCASLCRCPFVSIRVLPSFSCCFVDVFLSFRILLQLFLSSFLVLLSCSLHILSSCLPFFPSSFFFVSLLASCLLACPPLLLSSFSSILILTLHDGIQFSKHLASARARLERMDTDMHLRFAHHRSTTFNISTVRLFH